MKSIFSKLKERLVCSLFLLLSVGGLFAQDFSWHNPIQDQAVQGRVKQLTLSDGYGRLPSNLKSEVREPVWYLGAQSAGVYVEFTSNSPQVLVKYKVKNALNMPHMPTTGVSGVDLYAYGKSQNEWKWSYGKYSFKDTISYLYQNLELVDGLPNKYRLYLPLYNAVEWMEIGVQKGTSFTYESNKQKPIIVYGTSIAQGACASRPGTAWTNMLGRNFTNPVINLAFSGNGRLEQPILDLINETDAAVYLLDCIPNLSLNKERTAEDLTNLIVNAVNTLRKRHSKTPIILMAHSSSAVPGVMSKSNLLEYGSSSDVAFKTYQKIKKGGDNNIYWISSENIGFDIDSTVDYAHPNDIGMKKISEAYTKVLKEVLK